MSDDAMPTQHVTALKAMGFDEELVLKALQRANNEIEFAVELLSSGRIHQEEDVFDILQSHGDSTSTLQQRDEVAAAAGLAATTTNNTTPSNLYNDGIDPFKQTTSGTEEEIIDVRIAALTEMGFTAEQAIDTMKACGGDVNEAISLLTM